MINLQYSYIPYISNSAFNMIFHQLDKSKFNKSGSNSKCAILGDYAILKSSNIPGHDETLPKMIETLQHLKEQEVNVVPILGYGIIQEGKTFKNGERYDTGYIIQEKAPGKELLTPSAINKKSNEEKREIILDYFKNLSEIPQEHFDKWVADLKALSDHKVAVDPSKASNFFYDKKKGFSFIDLNFFSDQPVFDKIDNNGQQRHTQFICNAFTPFRGAFFNYPFLQHLDKQEDLDSVKFATLSAFKKTINALKKIGISQSDIDYSIDYLNIPLFSHPDEVKINIPTVME